MITGRKFITLLVLGIALAGPCYAGMTPANWLDTAGEQEAGDECLAQEGLPGVVPVYRADCLPELPHTGSRFSVEEDSGQSVSTSGTGCVLTERQDSLELCLYALAGLALCKSAPCVRRLSLGVVPGWYHDGGPFRIGHTVAISPDCLSTPLVCLVQPDEAQEELAPKYHAGTIEPLWRKSQFISSVLRARGPPSHARGSCVA